MVPALAGRIESSSDLGPSASDGVTAISRPVLVGTATPFAVVNLFVIRAGEEGPSPIGTAVADAQGNWRTPVGPLADGRYQLAAVQVPPGQAPGPLTALQQVTIDTVGPRVVALAYSPRLRQVTVVYRDAVSGLVKANLETTDFYTLIGPPRLRRVAPPQRPERVAAGTIASDPEAVVVTLPRTGRPPLSLRILSGGIADLAGNPLDGDGNGQLPSGDRLPGGNFVARLASFVRPGRVPGTRSIAGPAHTPDPTR
jgi:hypothetical protein